MPPVTNEPDELLDQVLEDERADELQNLREHDETTDEIANSRPQAQIPDPGSSAFSGTKTGILSPCKP